MSANFRIDDDILIMTLSGKLSLQKAIPIKTEVAQRHRTLGSRMLIVDMRKAHLDFSTFELFEFCISFQDEFLPGTRHAVLYSPDTTSVSEAQFMENVARNRGIILKMFSEYDDARAWVRLHTNS